MALIFAFDDVGQLGMAQPTAGLDYPAQPAEAERIARSFVYN